MVKFEWIARRLGHAAPIALSDRFDAIIDRVTVNLERKLVEVPVGFKWLVDGLPDGSVRFGDEESASASFCA